MENNKNQFLPILKFLRLALKNWYFIVGSLLLSLTLVWLYHRYTVPTYRVQASLMVKSEGNSYADFIFDKKGGMDVNLNNEIAMLQSFGYVATTIASLDFNVSYYREGQFVTSELYPDSPIKVEINYRESENNWQNNMIAVKQDGENTAWLTFPEKDPVKIKFGEWVAHHGLKLRIEKKYDLPQNDRILFKLNTLESLTYQYMGKLKIYPQSASSTILNLSIVGENRAKEMAFLNKFLETAEKLNLNDKNYNYRKAIGFLDEQLDINTDSLQTFENRILDFQDLNNSVNLEAETSTLYSELQTLEAQKSQILINDKYYEYLLETLRKGKGYDNIIIPASTGVDDPALAELVNRLITSQMEVKSLLEDNKTKNPLVANKQKEINDLKTNILSTVENLRGAKQITLNEINSRIRESRVALRGMPKAQQQLGGIQRNYGINENLYMMLMNKKLETGIQLAANLSDYKKVNDASVAGGIVSPRYNQNYLFAGVAGLGVPLAILYLLSMLNSKIASKDELKEYLPVNVLTSIPHSKGKKDDASLADLDSPVGEAFRMLRTNLSYVWNNTDHGKVLMVSSAISGEGKTFVSQHLAYILAMAGKKVILINCDMRKPYTKEDDAQKGLSEYLAGMATYKEIEKSTYVPSLKMINSGKLPPNPSELLLNYRMESLLLDLKQDGYEYIILDSAPIGIFSDALGLVAESDLLLLVARQNYTTTSSLKHLQEVLSEIPRDKQGLVFNGTTNSRRQQAYGKYYSNYSKNTARNKKRKTTKKSKI